VLHAEVDVGLQKDHRIHLLANGQPMPAGYVDQHSAADEIVAADPSPYITEPPKRLLFLEEQRALAGRAEADEVLDEGEFLLRLRSLGGELRSERVHLLQSGFQFWRGCVSFLGRAGLLVLLLLLLGGLLEIAALSFAIAKM